MRSRSPRRDTLRSGALAGLAVLLLAAGTAASAPAHVELRSTSPEANRGVEGPVEEVVLVFTGSVQADLSRIDLTGPDGRAVSAGPVEYPSPDARDRIRVRMPAALEPGRYEVSWRTAAMDGHVVAGTFSFEVAPEEAEEEPEPAPEEPADPEPTSPEQEHPQPVGPDAEAPDTADRATLPAGTIPRWLQLVGVILLLGAVASRFGVIPVLARKEELPELRVRLRKGFWRAGWLGVIVLLAALPLRLWVQFGGEGAGWTGGEIVSFLFGTAWGAGWFLHLAVVVLGGLGLMLAQPRGMNDRGWAVLAAAALLVPLVSGLQGHAWGMDELRALAVSSIYLHVLGVGVWLGGLLLLLLVGLPAVRAEAKRKAAVEEEEEEVLTHDHNPHPPLFRLVNAFSRMVLPFVALFVVTGVVNSWIHLGGSVDAFVGTTYGRTLLLKLGFVAGALVLGFYNWRRVRPSLAANPDPGALRIPASVEAVLALLVLLVTAVLVAVPHP